MSVLFLGCNVTATDNRRAMPDWFNAMGTINGVNLPHLEPYSRFRHFVEDPSFSHNVGAMGWNTFRLPVEWDDYAAAGGELNLTAVREGIEGLRALVASLRQARRAAGAGDPVLLILDFHQYKFGAVCGGVGMPRGIIDESGLSRDDGNCVFQAFERFWHNPAAQRKWFAWARAFVEALPDILKEESDWLKVGIEPINEPQFGFAEPVFTNQMVTTIWNLYRFTRSGAIQQQIDGKLIPFYRGFLEAMADVPRFDEVMENGVMVFEPFVLDHLNISVDVGPVSLEVNTDGHYQGMLALNAVHWLAAPHHYVGALDEGFLSLMPQFARDQLSRYPNMFVDGARIRERFRWIQGRMAEAGMETMIGEWGTQTGLLDARGHAGGHRAWIADSKAAMGAHSRGGLWWQYVQDRTAGERSFYLLRSRDGAGAEIPWREQVLKCSGRFNLARLVFGRCPEERR